MPRTIAVVYRIALVAIIKRLRKRASKLGIGSVARKTHTKSSSSGSSVKPYVSKREREKIAQENALITASTISANHQLQEIGCHNPLESVESKSEPTD